MSPEGILIPAALAGLAAIGVTVAIERLGGRLGGLIGTLPSTIVPASIGIAQQSATVLDFQAALYITPAGMFLNALFLYLWRALPPRLPQRWGLGARLATMTLISLSAWIVAAVLVVLGVRLLRAQGSSLAWFGWVTTGLIALVGVMACLQNPPAPRGKRSVGLLTLLARGTLAAAAIGASVALAAFGGPLAAGVAAIFPAIFLTTMIAVWLSQGEAVQSGAVGPMMLGSTSVALFSVLSASWVPTMGLSAGTALAWVAAACGATLPAWFWLRWLAARQS